MRWEKFLLERNRIMDCRHMVDSRIRFVNGYRKIIYWYFIRYISLYNIPLMSLLYWRIVNTFQ